MGATPQGFESLPLRHLYLHFQGYYRSSVLEAVNKIIYHTAEQLRLLHCDNIQFDTVALLLLTLTHPRRITAIQLRMVSALSSLADTADTMYPIPENRLSSQSLVITKLAIQFVLPLGYAAGGDIHCGFTPCISSKQKQEFPADNKDENQLKTLAKMYVMCYTDSTMKALIH